MRFKISFLIVSLFFLIGWSNEPTVNNPVSLASGYKDFKQSISDGAGGTIVTWMDFRNGNSDIYAQKLDADGNRLWGNNGVAVTALPTDEYFPNLASDGAGGAIIVWIDFQPSTIFDVYAQRVSSDGVLQWGANGIAITEDINIQYFPLHIIPDGKGGAIFSWSNFNLGGVGIYLSDIYAQKIDHNGVVQWTPGGNLIQPSVLIPLLYNEMFFMVSDGGNGAVFGWTDMPSGGLIKAQKINSDGNIQWGAGGKVVSSTTESFITGLVATRAGNTVFIWEHQGVSTPNQNIYAQGLSSNGEILWPANDIPVATYTACYDATGDAVHDGNGGVFVVFNREDAVNPSYTVRLQHLLPNGTLQLGSEGLLISNQSIYQQSFSLVPDDNGGVIIGWEDARNNMDLDIYAQRVNGNGKIRWDETGVPVSTAINTQYWAIGVKNGSGGAIFNWFDVRNNILSNIFAQCIGFDGTLCTTSANQPPVAIINANRFGGVAPVTINFDGNQSYDLDGSVVGWEWTLGNGTTEYGPTLSYTYDQPGTYTLYLRVRDNRGIWSTYKTEQILVLESLDNYFAEVQANPSIIKANGKANSTISAVIYENAQEDGSSPTPVFVDIGLNFTVTSGNLSGEASFNKENSKYLQQLTSGEVGNATITGQVDGVDLGSTVVNYVWPLPPADLRYEVREDRGLMLGEYYIDLFWAANPNEHFVIMQYKVYRSINNGDWELIATVPSTQLEYTDEKQPPGNSYRYAVSSIDIEGDESDETIVDIQFR